MDFPLQMRFKILGIAPQIYVDDAHGSSVFYVKQKLFKLKEAVKVFADSSQSDLKYEIGADRILDFNAKYAITHADGTQVGTVGRHGMRSLFRATYDIYDGQDKVMTITEEAVWKRLIEASLGGIPILGFFIIMFINPTYLVQTLDGETLFKLTKEPAFFEGKFTISKVADDVPRAHETRAVLSMLMMALLERSRG